MGVEVSLVHTFAGNPLDRADAERRNEKWLATAMQDPTSRYLPFAHLEVLVQGSREPQLGWLPASDLWQLRIHVPPVLLGIASRASNSTGSPSY